MPIEFRCDQCQRLLRVPDQNAGAKARCPQCSHVQEVPFASTATGDSAGSTGNSWPGAQPTSPYNAPSTTPPVSSNPFADAPQQNPFSDNPYQSPYASGYDSAQSYRDAALSKVKAPAIILIVLAVIASGLLLMGLVAGLVDMADNGADGEDISTFAMLGVAVLMEMVVILGMARMLALKNYGLAMTATIFSMLCGMCSILTLPFSIWALVVLCDSNVRSQFT